MTECTFKKTGGVIVVQFQYPSTTGTMYTFNGNIPGGDFSDFNAQASSIDVSSTNQLTGDAVPWTFSSNGENVRLILSPGVAASELIVTGTLETSTGQFVEVTGVGSWA